MSDGPLPAGHRARHGHRYREDSEQWGATTQWDATAQWQPEPQWSDEAAPEPQWSGTSAPDDVWSAATTTVNGWAAPNPDVWAAQSRSNWDSTADPTPSGDYTPVYSFRTADGDRIQFSGDGARVDHRAAEPDRATTPSPAAPASTPGPVRAGGKRRAGGTHRLPAPPSALKGRAAVVAVAAGAVVAAGQATIEASGHADGTEIQASNQVREVAATQQVGAADTTSGAPQLVNSGSPTTLDQFSDILQKGQKFAADLANAEASKMRPMWTKFAQGTFTSGFGIRWGVAHQGVDIAGPIGTPIVAVADGTVLEAGPASGFGMWVRLLHDDGTVTIYGHIDTATVAAGQRVLAGDQIATIGNRGFSTGPHCHFEVWQHGVDKIDPLPWLASRGISLGPERD
ncbi:M23 family metallopeptidase [Nocardia sp. NPDC088792]|uniref:M23 family metallopeptidase n=1 Tax=Nocardia sp. NPDC088792 TaxID=3364332 RepID=UPI00382E2A1D